MNLVKNILTPYISFRMPTDGITIGSPASYAVRRTSEYNSTDRYFSLFLPRYIHGTMVIDAINSIALERNIIITPPIIDGTWVRFTLNHAVHYSIELVDIFELQEFDTIRNIRP